MTATSCSTHKRPWGAWRTCTGLAFAALGLVACVSSSPQAGDSATSWLFKACNQDDECGAGSCVEHLCTLPCDGQEPDTCADLHPMATCQLDEFSGQKYCDVECGEGLDCEGMGDSFACRQGQCRVAKGAAVVGLTRDVELWDVRDYDGLQNLTSTWVDDHWLLVAAGRLPQVSGVPVGTVTINPAGETRYELRELPDYLELELRPGAVSIADSGEVGLVADAWSFDQSDPLEGECRAMFYPVGGGPFRQVPLDCEGFGHNELFPVAGAGDWIVVSLGEAGWTVGAVDPATESWTQPLAPLIQSEAGDSVSRPFGVGGSLAFRYRPADAAQPTRVGRLDPGNLVAGVQWDEVPNAPDSLAGEMLDPRWQLFGHGTGLLSLQSLYGDPSSQTEVVARVPKADGSPGPAARFRLAVDQERFAGVQGVETVPQRGWVAFCHAEANLPLDGISDFDVARVRVFLSVFDARGGRIAGPTNLRELPLSAQFARCEVRWSESAEAFLVAWRPHGSSDGHEHLTFHVVEMR